MDWEDRKSEIILPFDLAGKASVHTGGIVYCMVVNFTERTTKISLAERAMLFIKNPQVEKVTDLDLYTESGMSDEKFKQLVLNEVYGYSKSGHVRNIKSDVPGCVYFEANHGVYPYIADTFPVNKFTMYADRFAQERDDRVMRYKDFLERRKEYVPEYESRPYLDS